MFSFVCISVSEFLRDASFFYPTFNCNFSGMVFLFNSLKASFIVAKAIASSTINHLRSAASLISPYFHFKNSAHAWISLIILCFWHFGSLKKIPLQKSSFDRWVTRLNVSVSYMKHPFYFFLDIFNVEQQSFKFFLTFVSNSKPPSITIPKSLHCSTF